MKARSALFASLAERVLGPALTIDVAIVVVPGGGDDDDAGSAALAGRAGHEK